jgi:hypothetical protein
LSTITKASINNRENYMEMRSLYLREHFWKRLLKFLYPILFNIINRQIPIPCNIDAIIDNKIFYAEHLCRSNDFDIFLFGISLFSMIPQHYEDLDQRDMIDYLFKFLPQDRIERIFILTDLLIITKIDRKDTLSNIDLVKLHLSQGKFISNNQYSKAIISCWENNDKETFNYLFDKAIVDNKFLLSFGKVCANDNLQDLFLHADRYGLNIDQFLHFHGTCLYPEFYQFIINNFYEEFLDYFAFILKCKINTINKIYDKIRNLKGIIEIKLLYLELLLSYPLDSFRTKEDQIITKITEIVNSFSDPYELYELYKLSRNI